MTDFMVINLATAEVEPSFSSRESAERFCEEIKIPEVTQSELDDDIDLSEKPRTLIMPCEEMEVPDDIDEVIEMFEWENHPELVLYHNAQKGSPFRYVAEYFEDNLNDDFISTQDIAVRYAVQL